MLTLTASIPSLGQNAVNALLGYAVVFLGLLLLMAVIYLVGRLMTATGRQSPVSTTPAPPQSDPPLAPGSAGQVKLHGVSERDAAMLMAIVAHRLEKPLNELRFKSIREVEEDEI